MKPTIAHLIDRYRRLKVEAKGLPPGVNGDHLGDEMAEVQDAVIATPATTVAEVVVPIEVRGFPHFVIFRGLVGDRVAVADPAWGNRTMAAGEFDDAWKLKIGFVVTRPGQARPPADNKLVARPADRLLPSD